MAADANPSQTLQGITSIFLAASLLLSGLAGAGGADSAKNDLASYKLVDVTGKTHHPGASKGTKAVVFVYVDTHCPIANFYQPTLRKLARKFQKQGVLFFQVHPDPDRSKEDVLLHIKEFGVVSPVILDSSQKWAKLHQAKATPEAHLIAPDGTCLYRGRIDDTYTTYGKRRPKPTTRDLEAALIATLAGKKIATPVTKAIGCQILIED